MRELFNEAHANAQCIALQYLADDLLAQKQRIGKRGRTEDLVHDDDAARRSVRQDLIDAHQVVLELASQVLRVFFALEVSKQSVAQKQHGAPARYRTANLRQIVQLTERARKGRLPTIVGTRHDNQALFPIETKIVADDLRLVPSPRSP